MFPDRERYKWLEGLTGRHIKKCKRTAKSVPGYSEDVVTVYVPGGDDKYPSFWIRDAVMQCRSELIGLDDMKTMLEIMLFFQNETECRSLENGLRITPWAIPDHINLPGLGNAEFEEKYQPGPVFFPGTYSSGNNQGEGYHGFRPADDSIYEVVELARLVIDQLPKEEKRGYLQKTIKNKSILERLDLGMQEMVFDKKAELCVNTSEDWSASNFHDGLKPMGFVAITSCLRFRAAKEMAELYGLADSETRADYYRSVAEQIANSMVQHLYQEDGWIKAATELNRQPDVWSTSMAVYYGIFTGDRALKACESMLKAYERGVSVNYKGYLRHLPTFADIVPGEISWEEKKLDPSRRGKYGVYQNGGYWPQPLGYYVYCLAQLDLATAKEMACSFIDHTKELESQGAPFEWINPDIPLNDTPSLGRFYGPSAALPLEGFKRLSGQRSGV